ncbi:hypothetical protein T12_6938 [Trichinella patagoniensis]|uniref:Uncharacterized protein n=1 Tax=Trichinella patagoniensis TaxID=990121 RepID=A0A0V0Z5F0_9BILA|nr:hypothetical protein T12_6938 [Trichinella patagoniensis]
MKNGIPLGNVLENNVALVVSYFLCRHIRGCTNVITLSVGSVGNAFVGLTEEDSQHLSEKLKVTTPLQINAVTYTVALITADLESLGLNITKSSEVQAICSRFRVIQEVGFSFKWSFERSTVLKTLIVRMNAEGALRTKNTATLTRFVKRDGSSDIMRFSQRLQHIAEWNNSGGASKAEQSRVTVCRGSFVISFVVLNKALF